MVTLTHWYFTVHESDYLQTLFKIRFTCSRQQRYDCELYNDFTVTIFVVFVQVSGDEAKINVAENLLVFDLFES